MQKIETVSAALSNAVRTHESEARALYGASREALASDLGPNGAKTITNALQPGRRSARGRMARRDALTVVEHVSWPSSRHVWPGVSQLPTERDLAAFFRRSRELLKEIEPPTRPTYVNPTMPGGTAAALAASSLPKLLASRAIHHMETLGVSKRLVAKSLASGQLEKDFAAALRVFVGRFEKADEDDQTRATAYPKLERLLRARHQRSPENVAAKKRKDRERELRAVLNERRRRRRRPGAS